jgi:hypothetical protein
MSDVRGAAQRLYTNGKTETKQFLSKAQGFVLGFPKNFRACRAIRARGKPFVGGAYKYTDPTPSKNLLRIKVKLTLPASHINGLAWHAALRDKTYYGKCISSCNDINGLGIALC